MRRVYLICINLFLRSHGPNPYIDFRVRKLSVSFNTLRVYVCVCVYLYVCPECIFHCLLCFFSFSGDNTLPKAIDTLMRCYQGFFVAINFIIRILCCACLRDNFFFRCPMLTFNDLPHFLPFIIFNNWLWFTHAHILSLSFALPYLLFLPLPIIFPIALSHFRFQLITHSFSRFLGSNNSCFDRSRYIYSGINGSDIVDNEHFVSLQTTIHFAKWRSNITLIAHCT